MRHNPWGQTPMNGVRPIHIFLLFVIAGMACSLPGLSETPTESPKPHLTDPPSVQSANQCGDGICAGPENMDRCPEDCDAPVTASSQPSTEGMVPPLYFFYVIHTHVEGDWKPYEGPPMVNLDTLVADNMLAAINGIRTSLDTYSAQVIWEVVYGTAKGLCAYQGENHIFRQLQDSGHEIGLHVHDHDDYERDYVAIHDTCGLDVTVTSGIKMFPHNLSNEEAQTYVTQTIETNIRDFGINMGTINLSTSSALVRLCPDGVVGVGNDMAEEIGQALFPWRVGLESNNICADSPTGSFVFIEHLEMPSWTNRRGNQQADLFTEADFERLQSLFDSALAYMETHRPTHVAVWGFVTHISEFAEGDQGEMPPDPATLALLDRFLAYVDTKRAEGRVVYAPASQIAEIAFPYP